MPPLLAERATPSFLLAEAARSECAPSMRAVKDSLAAPLRRESVMLQIRKQKALVGYASWLVTKPRI